MQVSHVISALYNWVSSVKEKWKSWFFPGHHSRITFYNDINIWNMCKASALSTENEERGMIETGWNLSPLDEYQAASSKDCQIKLERFVTSST